MKPSKLSLYHKKFFCMNFHLVIFIFYDFIYLFIISFNAVYFIVTDLGINISHSLKWYHHICRIQHTASLCAYRVLHCFSSKNVWTLLRACFTYVRPKLEYNTPVWSPYLKERYYY